MSLQTKTISAAALALTATLFALPASAVPVLCEDATRNHMYVDSSYISSCLDAGVGNINGNPANDAFLTSNPSLGYTNLGEGGFVQSWTGSTGLFWIDPTLWNTWSDIAIGFKFGTGNQPDEWFVYALDPNVSAGSWSFVNTFGTGGGLSHVQLYGSGSSRSVPEPGTLGLAGIAMIGAALARRRKQLKA